MEKLLIFAALACVAAGLLFWWIRRRAALPPVVCVCTFNGWSGVVRLKDYIRAHRRKDYPGQLAAPADVFVFKAKSPEYLSVVSGCHVRHAIFLVPWWGGTHPDTARVAHQHIHGKPLPELQS